MWRKLSESELARAKSCGESNGLFKNMNDAEPINVNEDSFEAAVTKSPVPVVVDFWAPWCGPCRMLSPIVEEIAKEKAGAVRVAKVNVDDNPGLGARYSVRSIPMLLFFKDGEVRDQVVGLSNKQNIVAKLEALV